MSIIDSDFLLFLYDRMNVKFMKIVPLNYLIYRLYLHVGRYRQKHIDLGHKRTRLIRNSVPITDEHI